MRELPATDIADHFAEVTRSAISQHLAVLKTAGLVTERRDGTRRLYRAERNEMKKLRTRFGSRLVPAQELLPDIIKRRDVVRAVAMVADQEPTKSERKYWTRFLNRDTAFYMGPEEIARTTRFPVFFIAMRRTARGYYEMEFQPLSTAGQSLPSGALTERYARLVEGQIHSAPPDWPWSHKRWKLKKSVYQSRAL